MARTKNKFLNAKPVTKTGGNSNGVRNPAKPYKPPAKPSKPTKPAKPAKPAPNSRTAALKNHASAKPDARINANNFLPNSKAKGINLPNAGANAVTGSTQGPNLKGTKPGTRPLPAKPSGNFKAPSIPKPGKPAAKPPVSGVRRVGGGLVSGTILTAAAGKAIDTLGRAAQPSEWNRVQRELQARGYGGRKPVNKDPNGRSSTGVRVSDKANQRDYNAAPTGSQQYNDYRNRQIADNRARLQGVGNPPKPKPPAPRQQPPAASAPAARPSASRPSQTRPSRTTATGSGSQQARPAEKKPSMGREAFDRSGKGSLGPNYGIDQFGDKNGIDMERRRAFLDAKDSQEGRKAINKLMEERRKKQRENDSTSK